MNFVTDAALRRGREAATAWQKDRLTRMGLRATSLGNVRRPPYDGCDTHRIRISGEAIRGFGRLNGLWAKGSDASALKTVCTKRYQCRILDGTFVQPIRL